jgi:hypothetical protein
LLGLPHKPNKQNQHKESMKAQAFYQIENPTTKQIFDAIINGDYTPLESIQPKAKQVRALLRAHFNTNEVLVTFNGVTNTGGIPIFLGANDSLYEIASEQNGFYELTDEEKDETVELLGAYLRTYDDIFNL